MIKFCSILFTLSSSHAHTFKSSFNSLILRSSFAFLSLSEISMEFDFSLLLMTTHSCHYSCSILDTFPTSIKRKGKKIPTTPSQSLIRYFFWPPPFVAGSDHLSVNPAPLWIWLDQPLILYRVEDEYIYIYNILVSSSIENIFLQIRLLLRLIASKDL